MDSFSRASIGVTQLSSAVVVLATAVTAALTLVLPSTLVRADEIETEHLFGFVTGSDVGEVGEREVEGQTLGRIGAAWSAQVAGRAVDDSASLDLKNFQRHEAKFKFGVSF